MRIPSIERRIRLQAEYRDGMAEWASAAEAGDDVRAYAARARVAEAVQGLRRMGTAPIRGRLP